jgi:hypothetical protein
MAADIYFAAQAARRTADEANELANLAGAILTNITSIRRRLALAIDRRDGVTEIRMHTAWDGACESRNIVIAQWQRLTGRAWDAYGDNLIRA